MGLTVQKETEPVLFDPLHNAKHQIYECIKFASCIISAPNPMTLNRWVYTLTCIFFNRSQTSCKQSCKRSVFFFFNTGSREKEEHETETHKLKLNGGVSVRTK